MTNPDLHVKYAPIMRFARGEHFYPMAVDDFLAYSALYAKGEAQPVAPRGQVQPADLARSDPGETFLRSVTAGPLEGLEIAGQWGKSTLRLLWEWGRRPPGAWTTRALEVAYRWVNAKTRTAAQRFWWNDLVLPNLEVRKHRKGSELPRFVLPLDVRTAAIDAYESSQGTAPRYTYYHRLVEQGGYLGLQYWFFYAYNDWANGFGGFNDHEGDWESFQVFFKLDGGRPVEPPEYLCYLGHHSRMTKPWAHPEVEKVGTHPVIYVAAGSHASYPQPRHYPLVELYNLIDYATGDALTVDHDDWRQCIPLTEGGAGLPLLTYRGSWGTRYWLDLARIQPLFGVLARAVPNEVALPGVSAPRGPRFTDEGGERESWRSPLAFAGIR